jgi:hypothetical protein
MDEVEFKLDDDGKPKPEEDKICAPPIPVEPPPIQPPAEDEPYQFSALSDQEKSLLVPLPYRVGYWISQSDTDGGDKADRAELEALDCLITSYAQDMCKSEFVQRMMDMTVKGRKNWESWQENPQAVPEECRKACLLLADRLNEKELAGFQENLFEIALTVAGVFREDDIDSPDGFFARFSEKIKDKTAGIFTGGKGTPAYDNQNISSREKSALRHLRDVMGM